jgi:hypothetical protein
MTSIHLQQGDITALSTVGGWVAEHADALDTVTFVLFSADSLGAYERARARI